LKTQFIVIGASLKTSHESTTWLQVRWSLTIKFTQHSCGVWCLSRFMVWTGWRWSKRTWPEIVQETIRLDNRRYVFGNKIELYDNWNSLSLSILLALLIRLKCMFRLITELKPGAVKF